MMRLDTQNDGVSVQQVFVALGGGVPEVAADIDGARQFKLSNLRVEGIQREIRGSQCVMKTYRSADSRLRSE